MLQRASSCGPETASAVVAWVASLGVALFTCGRATLNVLRVKSRAQFSHLILDTVVASLYYLHSSSTSNSLSRNIGKRILFFLVS